MNAIMKQDKTIGELFLNGHPDDVVLREGDPVQVIDQQTTGKGEAYAVKINPSYGRPYVWIDEEDLRFPRAQMGGTMSKERFTYGNLTFSVEDVGEGVAPWDDRQEPRTEYKVSVKAANGATYSTKGWGSTNDYRQGKLDHRGMVWGVIQDLLSAAADPDEFITLVIGEESGRKALERGKTAEKVIKAAKKFKFEDLEAASQQAQEEGA